jgi:1-deoxy-D-xylulose 5-phosphate reductoisomerase
MKILLIDNEHSSLFQDLLGHNSLNMMKLMIIELNGSFGDLIYK